MHLGVKYRFGKESSGRKYLSGLACVPYCVARQAPPCRIDSLLSPTVRGATVIRPICDALFEHRGATATSNDDHGVCVAAGRSGSFLMAWICLPFAHAPSLALIGRPLVIESERHACEAATLQL